MSFHTPTPPEPPPSEKKAWSIHDGQAFAANVFADKPRAPAERRFLESEKRAQGLDRKRLGPQQRIQLREMGIPASTIERLAQNNLRLLQTGTAPLVLPAQLKDLGGSLVPIDDLRIESLLGLGSFSSVHIAKLLREGKEAERVALKVFFHPISREGATPGGSEMAVSNPSLGGASDYQSTVAHQQQAAQAAQGSKGAGGSSSSSPRTTPNNSRHKGELWKMASKRAPDPRYRKDADFEAYDAYSFAQEVALLSQAALRHPNIVAYVGHGYVATPDGIAGYIVTKLILGDVLYDRIARHRKAPPGDRLPLTMAVSWARDVASALAFLHSHGVVHRDIKESNVMLVEETNEAMLIDLGLAMQGSPGAEYRFQLRERFGVKGYRAPEVNRQEPYSSAVDCFAFGRVVYNMLSAVEPPPKRKRSLLGLRAYLWDQWLDAGLCGSNQTRCWAYDTLFCEPPVHPSWPFVISTMIRRCTMSSPSMRPSAAQNLKTLEDVRDALIQRDDAIGAAVRGSPTSM